MKKYEEGVVIGGSKKRYNLKEKIYITDFKVNA